MKRARSVPDSEELHTNHEAESPPVAEASGAIAVPVEADPILSDEQAAVMRTIRARQNIFLTGSAGVGKSVTLRAIIQELRSMYGPSSVEVCASTGIAAEPLGGRTLHSFANCGMGEYYRHFLNCMSPIVRERLIKTNALVVDEISMVSVRSGELWGCLGFR
jgi:hypothetical protein